MAQKARREVEKKARKKAEIEGYGRGEEEEEDIGVSPMTPR